MHKSFVLTEEEKKRIINKHLLATKNLYLNEQGLTGEEKFKQKYPCVISTYGGSYIEKFGNTYGKKTDNYLFYDNGKFSELSNLTRQFNYFCDGDNIRTNDNYKYKDFTYTNPYTNYTMDYLFGLDNLFASLGFNVYIESKKGVTIYSLNGIPLNKKQIDGFKILKKRFPCANDFEIVTSGNILALQNKDIGTVLPDSIRRFGRLIKNGVFKGYFYCVNNYDYKITSSLPKEVLNNEPISTKTETETETTKQLSTVQSKPKRVVPQSFDEIKNNKKTLRKGDKSPLVKELQTMLKKVGYLGSDFTESETFDNETKNAVIDFQSKNVDMDGKNLKTDGVVGKRTLVALEQEISGKSNKDEKTGLHKNTMLPRKVPSTEIEEIDKDYSYAKDWKPCLITMIKQKDWYYGKIGNEDGAWGFWTPSKTPHKGLLLYAWEGSLFKQTGDTIEDYVRVGTFTCDDPPFTEPKPEKITIEGDKSTNYDEAVKNANTKLETKYEGKNYKIKDSKWVKYKSGKYKVVITIDLYES